MSRAPGTVTGRVWLDRAALVAIVLIGLYVGLLWTTELTGAHR